MADADGLPCYLDTPSERSLPYVSYYPHFVFIIIYFVFILLTVFIL